MITTIIIKNQNATPYFLEDLGIEIGSLEEVNLTEIFTKEEILNSSSLKPLVANGTFVVNDGTQDLSTEYGKMHIRVDTEYEDLIDDDVNNDNQLALLQVRRNSDYTFNNNFTSVPFDTEDVENDNTVLEWSSSNPTRIYIKNTGYYRISYDGWPDVDADQFVYAQVVDNSGNVLSGSYVEELQDADNLLALGKDFIYHCVDDSGYIEIQFKSEASSGTRLIKRAYASVYKLDGVKGDKGNTGTGSTINVENSANSYNNIDTLNFTNATISESPVGQTNITVDLPSGMEIPAVSLIRNSADISLSTSFTDISFDTTDIESQPSILVHNAINQDRINIKEAGLYSIQWKGEFQCTNGNFTHVYARIRINDSTVISESECHGHFYVNEIQDLNFSIARYLSKDDYLTLQLYSDDNGNVLKNMNFYVMKLNSIQGPEGPQGASGGDDLAALQVRRTNSISPASNTTWEDLYFETVDVETQVGYLEHDISNLDRELIKTDGVYKISYSGSLDNGKIEIRIRKNDSVVLLGSNQTSEPSSADTENISSSIVSELNANDFITLQIRGGSGANLNDLVFNIIKLEGAIGPQGIPGGSDVDIDQDNTLVASNVTEINFSGDVSVNNDGSGKVTVDVTGGGSAGFIPNICQVYDSSGGTDLNTATATAVPFASETIKDNYYVHSTSSNVSRVSVTTAGWYKITYSISVDGDNNSRRTLKTYARKNGNTDIIPSTAYDYLRNNTDDKLTCSTSFVTNLNTNDYIEILGIKEGSNGSALTVANESWILIEFIKS